MKRLMLKENLSSEQYTCGWETLLVGVFVCVCIVFEL